MICHFKEVAEEIGMDKLVDGGDVASGICETESTENAPEGRDRFLKAIRPAMHCITQIFDVSTAWGRKPFNCGPEKCSGFATIVLTKIRQVGILRSEEHTSELQ